MTNIRRDNMSVYKSMRSVSIAEYLKDAHKLRLETMKIVKKFPTSYRWIFTNNLLELASEIYSNCIKGNSIKVDLRFDREDFLIRHNAFLTAQAAINALLGEITFAYELLQEGNNFFAGKKEYEKKFQTWAEIAVKCLESIDRAVADDNKRQYKREENKKQYNGRNGKRDNRPKSWNKNNDLKTPEKKEEQKDNSKEVKTK